MNQAFAELPKLLLVDDHTTVREGLIRIIEANGNGWDITEVGSGFQALTCLRNANFKLAIIDLSLPGMSGLDLIQRVRGEYPDLRILVLSMHDEEQYALRAYAAGANGYLTKDTAAAELIAAINKVTHGGAYVTSSLAERVIQQLNGGVAVALHSKLSNREIDVMRRIVSGQRLTDIAEALHLSVKTVSSHKARILEKLHLDSTAALIRYGMEHQMSELQPPEPGGNPVTH